MAYPRNGSTFSTVAESFSALSSHPTQGDPVSPLQPAPLSQGMQQGQGSSVSPGRGAAQQHGGGERRELGLTPLCQELASCCATSIDDKFGTGSTKSSIKRSRAERRAAELRASSCSWASFFPLFSSCLGTGSCYFPVFPQTLASIPCDRCGNPQTKTTSGTAGSVPGCRAKLEREPARGREKKKDGLRKNMPFRKRQIEMFKGRWQGEERRRTGLLQAIVGIKAFGEKERGIPCPPSA